jgi:hypothetical protein
MDAGGIAAGETAKSRAFAAFAGMRLNQYALALLPPR